MQSQYRKWSLFLPVLIFMAVSMLMQIVVIKCWILSDFEGHADRRDSSCLAVRHHLAGHFCQSINKHTEIKLGLGGGVMQPEPLTSDLKDGIVASK